MAKYTFDEAFEQYFIHVCLTAPSMSQAAIQLKMNYKTLCNHAKRLNCFKSNQAGKGLKKPIQKGLTHLSDIFNGTVPTIQTHKLKLRLIREGYKAHRCENCGPSKWQGVQIPLELHHHDGNRFNNALENLQLLCPNCHALTDTYRAKNIRNLSARLETTAVEPLNIGETSR